MTFIVRPADPRRPPEDLLEMTADGGFIDPPSRPWSDRLIGAVMLIGGASIAVIGAVLALWFALLMIPVLIAAGLIGYAALRWYMWKARQAMSKMSVSGQPFGPFGRR